MKKKNIITKLNKIHIHKFRRLKDLDIELANRITLICGKNGTAKSTILGMIAQILSFEKDYSLNTELDYTTISGERFKSVFSDHFRFSPDTDKPGSMNLDFEIFDAYQNETVNARLELNDSTDRKNARPIVRQLTDDGKIKYSRNFTHPVIYLGLGRLIPISQRKQYSKAIFEYLEKEENSKEFKDLTNRILLKMHNPAKKITPTRGSLYSSVTHGDDYDQDSVSAGEDNVGQLVLALLSFKKLKEEYSDYHGGILLIDEADAGLYPGAQEEFIRVLNEYSTNYDLQTIITSHSPIMINNVLRLSKENKTLYLTDSYGKIEIKNDWNWEEMECDLLVKSSDSQSNKINLHKVDFYFEDSEAIDFYKKIQFRSKNNKHINIMNQISLGCDQYKSLVNKKIPTFYKDSVIILDGDQRNGKNYQNIIYLPTLLAPDQLVFFVLHNIDINDDYWKNNPCGISKVIFSRAAQEIYNRLNVEGNLTEEQFYEKIRAHQGEERKKLRKVFKDFYKNPEINKLIKLSGPYNPYEYYLKPNPLLADEFKKQLEKAMRYVLTSSKGYSDRFITENYFS